MMDFLKTSLDSLLENPFLVTDFLMYGVGLFILTAAYFVVDIVYLEKKKEFKRVFGKSPKRIITEEIDRMILSEYSNLIFLKDRIKKTSAVMEKERLQMTIENLWEKIRDMERCATVNGFTLSSKSNSILNHVNKMVVKYTVPTA